MFWQIVGQLLILTAPGCFIPVILALTPGRPLAERISVSFLACVVAAAILAAFALFGGYVLEFFGFSIAAFKIASGTYLIIVSLGLMFDVPTEEKASPDQRKPTGDATCLGLAITPLAVPFLAGPGMISVVLMRCAESATFVEKLFLSFAIAITFAMFFAIVCAALLGARYIGKFALDVARKITGVYAVSVGFLICFGGITTAFFGK
ncbi:MAG: NAAT family transporter [Puniceicoccales bacterium]|jgi:multiple antibiotic resistance protein|nr:NAAT family transporter [Puniceicoccales bacterium]